MNPPESPQSTRVWRNWSGLQSSRPAAWLCPRDEGELVASLRATNGELRVTGAGHSFSALCCTGGTLVCLDALNGVIEHDPLRVQATVWAGTRLRELGEALWQRGQALPNQGDVDVQSVAGACATGTHGTGLALGSLSAAVHGLRLVTAQGEVMDADESHEADVFQAARTSLGALGVVSRLRLQNRPAYALRGREFVAGLDQVLDGLDAAIAQHRHYEFWAFFHARKAIVKVLDESTAPETPTPRLALPVNGALTLASRVAHGVPGAAAPLQRLLTRLHTPTDRVGRSHRIFPSVRATRFNEMEYELPLAHGPECLREILHTVRRAGLRTLFPIEYRTVAADPAWLSPFYQRASASISVHQYHAADHRALFDLVEPIFWKYEGRPHWGKLHSLDARRLAPLYPRWDDFQRVRRQLDPLGRMLNPHLRHLLEPA